jgi:hypothetical protein
MAKGDNLSLREESFCKLYVSADLFGNGTKAYMEAYSYDKKEAGKYETARVKASQMLKKPKIYKRIAELLDKSGFNDLNVDKQLLFLIEQSCNLGVKMRAIREYNRLRNRVITKLDVTTGGQPINEKPASYNIVINGKLKDLDSRAQTDTT